MTAEPQRDVVVRVEDLAEDLADILEFSRERAEKIRRLPSTVSTSSVDEASGHDELTARLLAVLEDEIVPAKEVHDGKIARAEVDREIIKKALVGLKGATLKRISREVNLPVGLPVERLAENIAKRFAWDEVQIARLVLENDTDVRAERGHSTRFFPLTDAPDLERVRDRLSYVGGRYIRTGIAKWFVFDEVEQVADRLQLSGSLRTYEASIDGRMAGTPRLSASAAPELPARVEVGDDNLLVVEGASVSVAREAVRATNTAADVSPMWRIPFIDTTAPAERGELHDASRFMLDLLVNRLKSGGLAEVNMTVAHFKTKEVDDPAWNVEVERRASVKVVQFEGDYLLGSRSACQLLAVDQRPLSDMTVQVTTRGDDRIINGRFPARITIDRDHVSVSTSFGYGNVELSAEVHDVIVRAVRDEIIDGFEDEDRLDEFAAKILLRAEGDDDDGDSDILDEDRI